MTDNQHKGGWTPGRWTVGSFDEDSGQINVMAGGLYVAGAIGGLDEQEANARLIAAAPDMAEALQAAEFLLASLCVDRDSHTRQSIRSALLRAGVE